MKRTLATLLTLVCLSLAAHAQATNLFFGTWVRSPQNAGTLAGYAVMTYVNFGDVDRFQLGFTSYNYSNVVATVEGEAVLTKDAATKQRFVFFPDDTALPPFNFFYNKQDRSFYFTMFFPPSQAFPKGYKRKVRGFLFPPGII